MTPNILFLDLDTSLVQDLLASISAGTPAKFETSGTSAEIPSLNQYDLIFYPCEMNGLQQLLLRVADQKPGLPVIVVSRHPEVSQWLDALEAGAADYCAPPMEPTHVRWMFQQHLRNSAAIAA